MTPFASLVSVAADKGRFPVLLLSDLAVHTRNIKLRPRASLLLAESEGMHGDPLVRQRLTLSGEVMPISDQTGAARIFLNSHPDAAGYAAFGDFSYYHLICSKGHLVAGFGRIAQLSAEELFPQEFG